MGNLFKRYKWMQLFLGILLIVAGIVTIVISFINMGILSTTLSIIIAVVLFAFGGLILLSTFLEDKGNNYSTAIIYASLLIALGVILCIRNTLIQEVILYLVAVFCIAFGASQIIRGIIAIKYHAKPIVIILCFLLGAIGITLGIVSLCCQGTMMQIIYILVGALFIISGLVETIYGIKEVRK